jgi:ribulose-phosphate 3-epimerase
MIEEPEKYVEQFAEAGADIITVHYEATNHLHRALQQIKATGAKAGVALNPHTRVDLLFDVLEEIDLVCLMSVNPGFGGQKFIYSTIKKVRELKAEIISRNLETKIEIDGGVGLQNAQVLL